MVVLLLVRSEPRRGQDISNGCSLHRILVQHPTEQRRRFGREASLRLKMMLLLLRLATRSVMMPVAVAVDVVDTEMGQPSMR